MGRPCRPDGDRRQQPLAYVAATRVKALAVLGLLLVGAVACGRTGPEEEPVAGSAAAPHVQEETPPSFVDVTAAAGVRFVHVNGASERRYLPETMGSGVAVFDFDGDDRPDLYFVNGAPVAGDGLEGAAPPGGALYRNLGDGTFADVSAGSGLGGPLLGMGAAVGDYDNDGRTDLYVTAVGGDRLFHNEGGGRFADVTAESGLGGDAGFGTGAAFVDVDGDGWLDLFAGRYVTWSPAGDVACSPDGVHRTYCTPEVYPGESNRLYRNLGGRRFEDVTRRAGLLRPEGKTLGVAVLDPDGDGRPDLAVANDTVRNFFFQNRGDGTFDERAEAAGFAFSPSGATRGGMGIAAGDLNGDGLADLVIGDFSQEMAAYYRATGPGQFSDDAAQVGLGLPTLMTLAFGTLVFDADGDGDLDVAFANGHIEPEIAKTRRLQSYAQRPQLFLNEGDGTSLHEVRERDGTALGTPYVGRGLAAADLDGDGDLDLVLTQNGGPAVLLRNDSPPRPWLRLRFVGRKSNRTGYGVRVTAVAGERRWVRALTSGGSYLSASEPVMTIGLGELGGEGGTGAEGGGGAPPHLDRLEVIWPSGIRQTIDDPPLDRLLVVEEPAR